MKVSRWPRCLRCTLILGWDTDQSWKIKKKKERSFHYKCEDGVNIFTRAWSTYHKKSIGIYSQFLDYTFLFIRCWSAISFHFNYIHLKIKPTPKEIIFNFNSHARHCLWMHFLLYDGLKIITITNNGSSQCYYTQCPAEKGSSSTIELDNVAEVNWILMQYFNYIFICNL